jgi:hypothetical protein
MRKDALISIIIILSCSKLCGALGYDFFLENLKDKTHCRCIDLVSIDGSITPFTLTWYSEPKTEEDE